MLNFIIRKILLLIPMMLIISFLIYAGIELMPGDAVDFLIPPDALATMNPQELEVLREELGLNDPFLIRYFNWLIGILHGDFGYSIQSGVPVSTLLGNTLPATLELSVAASSNVFSPFWMAAIRSFASVSVATVMTERFFVMNGS